MASADLGDDVLEVLVALTFTKKEWRSILNGEWSDMIGFDDDVSPRIKKALCPTDDDHYIVRWVSPIKDVTVWNLNCLLCGEGWWSDQPI